MPKKLHFAGYDFTSGPGGTVIHRDRVQQKTLERGDRISYKNINLWDLTGRIDRVDGKWAYVVWDAHVHFGAVKEWVPNLRRLPTSD